MQFAWLACILLASALPGCAEAPHSTARAGLEVAQEAASKFAADARLSQVVGIESADGKAAADAGPGGSDIQNALVPGKDARIGDGEARAWLYRFESSNGAVLVVVSGGHVRKALQVEHADAKPVVGDWSVDSDTAVATAMTVRDFANRTAQGIVLQLLVTTGQVTAWQLDAGGALVYINARTGAVVAPAVAELPPLPLRREAGLTGGSVDPVQESPVDQFSMLQEGHGNLTLAVVVGRPLLTRFTAHVAGPDGLSLDIVVAAPDPTVASYTAFGSLSNVPIGLYSVTYTVEQSAMANYQLHWCTDGDPVIQDPNNQACAALEAP